MIVYKGIIYIWFVVFFAFRCLVSSQQAHMHILSQSSFFFQTRQRHRMGHSLQTQTPHDLCFFRHNTHTHTHKRKHTHTTHTHTTHTTYTHIHTQTHYTHDTHRTAGLSVNSTPLTSSIIYPLDSTEFPPWLCLQFTHNPSRLWRHRISATHWHVHRGQPSLLHEHIQCDND